MRVSIISQVDGQNSHGLHLHQLVKRLPDHGIECIVRPSQKFAGYSAEVARCIQRGPNDAPVEIIIGPPVMAPTPGKKTIYMAAWESTRLHEHGVGILNACDLVITPSNFCAQVFSSCGVTKPLQVVPLGYSEAFDYKWKERGEFAFLCVGNLANGPRRKGIGRIVEHFLKAFPNKERVTLSIKLHPGQSIDTYGDIRINVDNKFYAEDEWAKGMASFDGLIHYGVGAYEMCVLEAMRSGLVVIAPQWGGHADYFNSDVGVVVHHNLVPAGDSWTGLGHWAQVEESAAIEAMRWAALNQDECRSLGHLAFKAVSRLTWHNHALQIAAAIKSLAPPRVEIQSHVNPLDAVTVCVTSFERPEFLERALASVSAFPHVVVSEMSKERDLGCHESWLRAAYMAKTPYVIILHDDDCLKPELAEEFVSTIYPALQRGLAVTWRGEHLWPDKVSPTEYFQGPTRELPAGELVEFLLRSQLSLSPIVTVFRRDVLIAALKEGEKYITHPSCQLRPGMLLGTEVLAHLRQARASNGWLYLDKVLAQYGVHAGSGTVQAERSGDLSELIDGYNLVRHHFRLTPKPPAPEPRLLFVYSDYTPHDADEKRRCDNAKASWDFHFNHGRVMEFKVVEGAVRDSREMLDPRPVPYVKDLIEFGMAHAQPEDIVVLANRDIILTTEAPDRIIAGVKRGKGVTVAVRRNWHSPAPSFLVRSVLNCKPDGGFDLFAFTPQWWKANRSKLPDMLLGREAWDTVFRTVAAESLNDEDVYVDNVIFHESHRGHWEHERLTNPGQIHNRRLGYEFFSKRNTTMAHWVVKQLSS